MANTTADKLNLLKQTKADIKTALANKGQTVDDTTPFSDYAEKINNIDTSNNISSYFTTYIPTYIEDGYEYNGSNAISDKTCCSKVAASLIKYPNTLPETITAENGTVIYALFKDCLHLAEFPELPACSPTENYNIICDYMFQNCALLTTTNCPNLINFTRIYSAKSMFCGCTSLEAIPSNLNLSNVHNATAMFYHCNSLTTATLNLPVAESVEAILAQCENLTSANLTASQTTSLVNAFYYDINLTNITLNAPKTTSLLKAFYNCRKLMTVDLSNVGNTNSTGYMIFDYAFYNCNDLTSISSTSALKPNSLCNAFYACLSLTSLPVIDLSDLSSTVYSSMKDHAALERAFYQCNNLTSISFINMGQMLATIDLSYVFSFCESLETISGFELPDNQVVDMSRTFYNCTALTNDFLNTILGQLNKLGTNYVGTKTLKYIGLSETQATTCTTLSNWSTAEAAGWTTGY